MISQKTEICEKNQDKNIIDAESYENIKESVSELINLKKNQILNVSSENWRIGKFIFVCK